MNKWTGFLISLIIIILAAFYGLGILAQCTLNKSIHSFPKNDFFTIQLNQYHRGWFTSSALLSLKLNVPSQQTTDSAGAITSSPPVALALDFPLRIEHGPFIYTDHGLRFGIAQVTTEPETHYGAFINFLNKINIKYSAPAFSIQADTGSVDNNFRLNWKGLTALFTLSSNLERMQGKLKLYGVEGSAEHMNLMLGQVTDNFKLKRYQDWLWLGQGAINVSSLSVAKDSDNLFGLEQFAFMFMSDVSREGLYFDYQLSLKKLSFNHEIYGPAFLKLSVRNIDPEAMAKINQQEFNMLKPEEHQAAMLAYLAAIPQALSKGPVVELSDMKVDFPDGRMTGHFKILIPKAQMSDPAQISQQIQGEGEFRAPMTVVRKLILLSVRNNIENNNQLPATQSASDQGVSDSASSTDPDEAAGKQTDEILQKLVTKGIFKIEADDYVLNFKLQNQQLLINGTVFTPDMLQ